MHVSCHRRLWRCLSYISQWYTVISLCFVTHLVTCIRRQRSLSSYYIQRILLFRQEMFLKRISRAWCSEKAQCAPHKVCLPQATNGHKHIAKPQYANMYDAQIFGIYLFENQHAIQQIRSSGHYFAKDRLPVNFPPGYAVHPYRATGNY